MNNLTLKQKIFIASYAANHNGKQAAIEAGYAASSAKDAGSRLLKHPEIQRGLNRTSINVMKKMRVTIEDIAEELSLLAFSNIRDCYDDDGNLMPVHKLPREVTACISEVTETMGKNGQKSWRYKMDGKTKNLELLGRYHQMFVDKIEVTTKDQFYEDIINNAKSHPKHAILERQRAMMEAIEHKPDT